MTKVIRGQTLSFGASHHDVRHENKGAIAVGDDGTILWSGPLSLLPRNFQGLAADDYGDNIVMPGFIDAHIHFPQLRMLAAPGKDLLDWLMRFTFPEEARYADAGYAAANAKTFLQTLYGNGTTAAMAFCSVHKACADALFAEAHSCNMALVTGKTMMDRNAIPSVHDDATTGGVDSETLYQTWHGKGRLRYAISPRFAVTSTEAQLKVAGELLTSYPDAMLQTHLSESPGEIAWIKTLFPNDRDYTAVYERFGLVNDHGVFAHGVHLSESECQRLHDAGAAIAHCPTSNNFLGSGLMPMKHLGKKERPVPLALATDVGGGTSYSMLATLGEAYKVQMLTGYKPSALELFFMATRGNAERLHLDHEIGALETGKFADIVVLDPRATPVLEARQELSQSLEDMLFALMILGDDRAVRATYVAGEKVHERLPT
ncbi:MAG: guanine deaminase [Aestuariivirga sp.]